MWCKPRQRKRAFRDTPVNDASRELQYVAADWIAYSTVTVAPDNSPALRDYESDRERSGATVTWR